MKGFTIKCNECGEEITLKDKIIDMKNIKSFIEIEGSGQIDISNTWITCHKCKQEIEIEN